MRAQSNLVAYGTNGQLGVFKAFQLRTKSAGDSIVQFVSTNLTRLVPENEFEKQFSIVCTIVQKPTYVRMPRMKTDFSNFVHNVKRV